MGAVDPYMEALEVARVEEARIELVKQAHLTE